MEGFLFAPEWGWRPLKGWVTSWYDEAEDCKGSSVYCVENMPTAGHLAEQQAVVVFWWGACGEGGKVRECLLKPSLHCKHASQRVPGACSIFKDLPALCVHAHVLSHFSHVWLLGTLWTVPHQASLSMELYRQEYWRGLPCPPPGELPDPGIKPLPAAALALQEDSLPLSHRGRPLAL